MRQKHAYIYTHSEIQQAKKRKRRKNSEQVFSYYIQFSISISFSVMVCHASNCPVLVFSCDREPLPMTLTFEPDLYSAKMNEHDNYAVV